MPTSGIKTSDEVKNIYSRVFNRKSNKLPYAVFKFSDDLKEIVVDYDDKYYCKEHGYNELLGMLPSDTPRFFCYDFPHLNQDGTKTSTVILISWVPPDTPTKLKFIVGTSFLTLAQNINVNKFRYFEGEDASDVCENAICTSKCWAPVPDAEKGCLCQESLKIKE